MRVLCCTSLAVIVFFKLLEKINKKKINKNTKISVLTINYLYIPDMKMEFSILYINSVQLSIMPA